jgi:hypothetical protein
MTNHEFCFWLKGFLDADPTPGSARINRMLDLTEGEDGDHDSGLFVAELRRITGPAFGHTPEIPAASMPGLVKALDNVLSQFDHDIPVTYSEAKRGFKRPGE